MSYYFRPTENYYGGMRRVRVSDVSAFNSMAIIFIGVALIYSSFFVFTPFQYRQLIVTLCTSVFVGPIAIRAAGGISKKGQIRYGLMCFSWTLFVFLNTFESTKQYAMYVIPAIPALLYVFHKSSPHVLKNFRYLERTEIVAEVFLSIVYTAIVLTVLYLVVVKAKKSEFMIQDCRAYLYMTINCVMEYGIILGVMFGVFSRKIMELRYPIGYLTGWNIVFWTMYQGASVIGYDEALLMFGGVFAAAFLQQLAMSISFYICRSTRIMLFMCLIIYYFYGSIVQ